MTDSPNYEALYLRERRRNAEWRRFATWLQGARPSGVVYGEPEKEPDDELRHRAIGALFAAGGAFPKETWREKDPLP